MSNKDGGPASPHDGIKDCGLSGTMAHTFPGMTLRDYFAAAALSSFFHQRFSYSSYGELAKCCFRISDAMIEAREGKK